MKAFQEPHRHQDAPRPGPEVRRSSAAHERALEDLGWRYEGSGRWTHLQHPAEAVYVSGDRARHVDEGHGHTVLFKGAVEYLDIHLAAFHQRIKASRAADDPLWGTGAPTGARAVPPIVGRARSDRR